MMLDLDNAGSASFEVIPSATGYNTSAPTAIRVFLPSGGGVTNSRILFHELMGIGWFHLRLASGT